MQAVYTKYAEIRDRKNLTDYEVSKRSNVSTATLSAWKSGTYTPKLDKVSAIALVLDVRLEDLLEAVKK